MNCTSRLTDSRANATFVVESAAIFSAPPLLRRVTKSVSSRFFGSKANQTEPTYLPNKGTALTGNKMRAFGKKSFVFFFKDQETRRCFLRRGIYPPSLGFFMRVTRNTPFLHTNKHTLVAKTFRNVLVRPHCPIFYALALPPHLEKHPALCVEKSEESVAGFSGKEFFG